MRFVFWVLYFWLFAYAFWYFTNVAFASHDETTNIVRHVETGKYSEVRCCVDEILRDKKGAILRSPAVRRQYRLAYPCPTGATINEPCAGWRINHVIPLACGGRDNISNMQWLPVTIKTCKEDDCVDRWERDLYCGEKNGTRAN